MASFTRTIDLAFKTLLFTKFSDILGIDKSGGTTQNINKGVVQCSKDIALRELAEKRGEDFLSFINFWRMATSPSWKRQRTSVARSGIYIVDADNDKTDTVHLKAMPVDLKYNVWFWSKDLDKVYQCIEKYIFWQQDNPNLTLKYDDKYELELDLHFGEIVDESSIDEKYTSGMLFVYKLPIKMDAWLFEGFSDKTIKKIILTCYDKDEVTNYSEIVVEDSNQDTELEAALRMFRRNLYGILEIRSSLNTIILAGNSVSDFSVADRVFWENSTSSNGIYTVKSSSLEGINTKLKFEEPVLDSVLKGNIYKEE